MVRQRKAQTPRKAAVGPCHPLRALLRYIEHISAEGEALPRGARAGRGVVVRCSLWPY